MRISDWSSDVCSSDLLFQKLLLAADVAAIAFGGHVLTKGGYGFARDDPAADGRLNRNLEQVAGDKVLHTLAHVTAERFSMAAVGDHRQRVASIAVHKHSHIHQVVLSLADLWTIED